jgi:hypothetical protein
MNFLRRHLFFFLALLPMGYLASIDLAATQSNPRHRWAVILLVFFMSIYIVQRFLLVRKKLRGEESKPK